jgi:5-formyltetrahydrofolate cyclo-ligase
VDAIIVGCVAVTPGGRRCGKGHGYGDLEYAILRELGQAPAPVFTTVHPLQIVRDLPAGPHDLPVSVIVTPDRVTSVEGPPAPPGGIAWDRLDAAALEQMPVLAELRRTAPAHVSRRRS